MSGQNSSIYGARLTRRSLLQSGGALLVGFGLVSPACNRRAPLPKNTLDATLSGSWIEIQIGRAHV